MVLLLLMTSGSRRTSSASDSYSRRSTPRRQTRRLATRTRSASYNRTTWIVRIVNSVPSPWSRQSPVSYCTEAYVWENVQGRNVVDIWRHTVKLWSQFLIKNAVLWQPFGDYTIGFHGDAYTVLWFAFGAGCDVMRHLNLTTIYDRLLHCKLNQWLPVY